MKPIIFSGELVKHRKTGLEYEVVRKPKEVLLYPLTSNAPVPSMITVRFKNEKGIADRMHLKLMQSNEPGSRFYSSPLPERVLITAGITLPVIQGPD